MLDYANNKAAASMTGCRYPLCLRWKLLESGEKKTPEVSQPEKLGQLSKVSYNEWKSLAKCKGTEASIVWARES